MQDMSLGSVAYMLPNRPRARGVDSRPTSSFGSVLYEMITPPLLSEDTDLATMAADCQSPRPLASSLNCLP
jgi:hypothetical protein